MASDAGALPEGGAVVIASADLLLRRTREADLDFVLAAENDPENVPFVSQWPRERHRAFGSDPGRLHLLVERAGDATPRGYLLLDGLGGPHCAVLVQRLVITDKGRGLGRKALELVMALAFESLGAHRVWLDARADNARARSLYRSLGFVEEGTLRECDWHHGRYLSLVLMGILEHEYRARAV